MEKPELALPPGAGVKVTEAPSSGSVAAPRPARTSKDKVGGRVVAQNTFILGLKDGLHARPATMIVRTAQCFASQTVVEKDGAQANARSILGLLGLAAGRGSRLKFTIEGPDAVVAMDAFRALFESDFTRAVDKDIFLNFRHVKT
jgi:phosphotransferase system HPr (HPr) family protein